MLLTHQGDDYSYSNKKSARSGSSEFKNSNTDFYSARPSKFAQNENRTEARNFRRYPSPQALNVV